MKNNWVKKALPHLVAIIVFLVVALIYCKPALDGKVLNQIDNRNALGAMHNSVEYSQRHNGQFPMWSNGLFGGMPAYQIGGVADNSIAVYVTNIMTLGLPKPFQFFFLASICFYLFCLTLRINPYAGIMGGLAFAYATYDPVIISVGHDTKMLSMAYMPAVLAGLLLIFDKKYWIGGLLTALFTSAILAMNHVQIVYYLLIVILVFSIVKLIDWIKAKEYKHLIMASCIAIVAGLTGVLTNAILLMTTYDYQKYTIRGGSSELYVTKKGEVQTTGLDQTYGLSYSLAIPEPLIMMFPKIYGGSSDKDEVSQEKSKAIEAIQSMPADLGRQLPLRYYWGGMTKEGEVGSSGPAYVGIVICLLAIFSFFIKTNRFRRWILICVGISIVLSWGSYFEVVNNFLFQYLPLYNKFRAPSMILVIPQLLLALSAAITVNYLLENKDKAENAKIFKQTLMAAGGLFILALLLYVSFDYLSASDKSILRQVGDSNQPEVFEYLKSFFEGLKADRKSLFMGTIMRSLFFGGVAMLLVYLAIKEKLKATALVIVFCFWAMLDIFLVNQKYFNSESFVENHHLETDLVPAEPDKNILMDSTYYRVFNVAGSFSENITSYLYNSVGGYHPAKLRIYQDLIEHQLSKPNLNFSVLNMLNAKYIIKKDNNGVTEGYQKNDAALGPCWLVKHIQYVKTADEEMKSLDHFNAKDTAFVLAHFKTDVLATPQYDSTASIQLVKNDNDVIDYNFKAANNQFAVFSEIYYPSGWKAFVDNKEVPIARVNYVLRGISVPAGKHQIQFRFEPKSVSTSKSLAKISWVLLAGFIVMFVFSTIKKNKQSATKNAS
ncbi:MAG TPA: YfhO family protein [Niabella sp.]|nr:YfhO family protein [Niabella sp.]HQW14880.1 YfhO family protein [Niabella sp.]HQX18495.1 YfhO family protein [Niabella sp.]HQX41493.1 YfhO family protein [Niabella sp.]HRB06022.1 YfhO family protein [Niabella sp.]